MDPGDKRLAVHVEDHPIDYAGFQGTIPEGNYGAGTVKLWDTGTWSPEGDADAGFAKGELKFALQGEKLRGRFVLIRLKPRPKERAENWLLIKERHDTTPAAEDAPNAAAKPTSKALPASKRASAPPKLASKTAAHGLSGAETPVVSRRIRDERKGRPEPATKPDAEKPAAVKTRASRAAAREAATQTLAEAAPEPKKTAKAARSKKPAEPAGSAIPEDARHAPLPEKQAPMLAATADAPPEGGEWLSEIKFDGYRLLVFKDDESIRILTRNGLDWTRRFPTLVRAAKTLSAKTLLLDGELVALRPDGHSHFGDLQDAFAKGKDSNLTFYAFDLLHRDGYDLRPLPLTGRKAALHALAPDPGFIRLSDYLEGITGRVRQQACAMGLEGIVCKRADSPYRAGRSGAWLKLKCLGREEFVILGWTPPQGSRKGLGALHLGFYAEDGALHYAGGCGSGFSDATLADLSKRLAPLETKPPASLLLTEEKPPASLHWVLPELVAEVQYTAWSGAGRRRHPVFLGLREDKAPNEVVRDVPDPKVPRHALGGPHAGRPARIVTAKKPTHGQRPRATPKDEDAAETATPAAASGDEKPVAGRMKKPGNDAPGKPGLVQPRKPAARVSLAGVELTHPERALWPAEEAPRHQAGSRGVLATPSRHGHCPASPTARSLWCAARTA